MKIVMVIGARPQFIKSAPVLKELKKNDICPVLVHTGQHFDNNMSDIFFQQMNLPLPDYNLDINNLMHGAMTARMLEKLEEIFLAENPDLVMVFGDTNSTLAGALAASKLHIKVAHVEAGLRSFNMRMPEEINRIITDRLSSVLFCPTDTSVQNLINEGFNNFNCKIVKIGDVMQDASILFSPYSQKPSIDIPEEFVLCTIHREENTVNRNNLESILNALISISEDYPIILPIHPRTKSKLIEYQIWPQSKNILVTDPLGYLEMIHLLKHCALVLTDSGGLQKEAFWFGKKCITLRHQTEWVELVENKVNFITGPETISITDTFNKILNSTPVFSIDLYGGGLAAENLVRELLN